jgi:hypothetical protein
LVTKVGIAPAEPTAFSGFVIASRAWPVREYFFALKSESTPTDAKCDFSSGRLL